MNEIFVPTLHSFENENTFTGSFGLLRFKLIPDLDQSKIIAKIWHGIFCFEKSEVEDVAEFPMTQEGRTALLDYLNSKV